MAACRVLFSTDQGFPLAAAFAYSVYQFQSKRVKRNPEGPFFGGNAMVGAIFSTLFCLAIACGVSVCRTSGHGQLRRHHTGICSEGVECVCCGMLCPSPAVNSCHPVLVMPLCCSAQVMALLTTPLTAILGQSTRQVGGFITIAVLGVVGIYLK